MNKIQIRTDVLEFIEDVAKKTIGYDVYLGGGYLRDLYCGLEPKDIDLFFIPNGNDRELPILSKTYINYSRSADEIPDMQERGVDKVVGLFAPKLSTCDVQFIVYKKFLTADELAADMDMNINQCMYHIESKQFFLSKEFVYGHSEMVIQCLHTFDQTRMFKRYERMKGKFPSYGVIGQPVLVEEMRATILGDIARRQVTGSYIEE
jgi:hypothetical protein